MTLRVQTLALMLVLAAAPFPARLTPAGAVRLAAADAARLPVADRPYVRYFWVGGVKAKDWPKFRAAFRLHINLLSRESEMADVVEVAPDLWRLDTQDVGWSLAVLENAAKIDPVFHTRITLAQDSKVITYWPGGADPRLKKEFAAGKYGVQHKKGDKVDVAAPWLPTKEILYLREQLLTEVPVLSAPWFLGQSCRQLSLTNKQTGLGYYDILQLKDRDDYFRFIKLNIKDSKELKKEIRAAIQKSGVSPLNRQVVRFQSLTGGAWITLDVTDETGRGNAVRNLDTFLHAAEEHYGVNRAGLPVVFLSSDKGVRQDAAPADAFGFGDDSALNESRDARIHINLACIRCHSGDILRPIDDYIRRTFKKGGPLLLQSADKKKDLKLKRKYLSDLAGWLAKDRAVYTEAFALATITVSYPKGMTPKEAASAYAEAYHAWADRSLTLADAARELGTTPTQWQAALVRHARVTGQLDLQFAAYLDDPPGKISRVSWDDSYQLAQTILLGLVLPAEKAKVK